jgi:hypothetical protein
MLENLGLPDFLLGEDVARPIFFKHEIRRPKRAGGIRVGFPKPGGAAIFSLKNVQNLIPDSGNCFSLPAQGEQGPLNSLVLAAESRSWRADASAKIVPRIRRIPGACPGNRFPGWESCSHQWLAEIVLLLDSMSNSALQ